MEPTTANPIPDFLAPAVPDFLKPAPAENPVKQGKKAKADKPTKAPKQEAPKPERQKPGPKAGVLKVTSPCPYCGEPAHRKAVQNVKGHGPLRRMYCANGCGHYHYRDVETNKVVEAGRGPKVDPLFKGDASAEVARLTAELKATKQALKRAESHAKTSGKEPATDWLPTLATSLGVEPAKLEFTADDGKGRPRALVNCLSAADITLLASAEDRETIERLHRALLTTQACIRVFKDKAKGK